jgi:hypothetical protein
MMIKKFLAVVAVLVTAIGVGASPAVADDAGELPGCKLDAPDLGSAGYSATFNGINIPVTITVGWQYTGPSWSACEDINVAPAPGHSWNLMSPRKVRTYMCSISNPNNCWHNAWRDIGASSGIAATDMANGVKYQVHFAIYGDDGPYVHLYH